MGEFRLNLSTRPFPAYRAVNVGLTAVLVVLIGVSVWQAFSYAHYTKLAGQIRSQEQKARAESDALTTKSQQLETKLDTPSAKAKLTEIGYLNSLIVRKGFSWTRVFSVLEQMIPQGVHLTSLRPDVGENGRLILHIDVRGKNIVDVSDFIDLLEKSDLFENVVPHFEEKKDVIAGKGDVDVSLTMFYLPDAPATTDAAANQQAARQSGGNQ
jgi:Tfp pilus assembly protein PilN